MRTLYNDNSRKSEKTRILIECAVMLALSTILSMIKIYSLPLGGSVTACSCVPLMLIAYRHGIGYGLFTAFNHSLIQLILGFSNVLYCKSLPTQIACILLDYVVAYTVIGLCSRNPKKPIKGAIEVMFLRFLCHFISGVYVWSEYWDSFEVWLYSLSYNGSYMALETLATVIVIKIMKDRLF